MSDVFRDYESGEDVRIAFDQTGRVLYGKFLCDDEGKAKIQMVLENATGLANAHTTGRYAMLVDYVYVKPATARA